MPGNLVLTAFFANLAVRLIIFFIPGTGRGEILHAATDIHVFSRLTFSIRKGECF